MKLERIAVRRLPGIDRPYEVAGLAGGVNLVVGPNGVGKSSLCRAVEAILWPGGARPEDEVYTEWRVRDVHVRAELAGAVKWSDESGRSVEPPAPPSSVRRAVLLGLRDLLDDDAGEDRELAERLRVQMAGGFDLRTAGSRFVVKRGHGRAEQRQLAEARRALHRLQGERRQLAAQDDSLTRLREELARAQRAESRLETVRRAVELRVGREGLEVARRALDRFEPGMEALGGDELELLKVLDHELEGVADEETDARAREQKAERRRAACELPGGPLSEAELNARLAQARELAAWEAEHGRRLAELAESREACRRSRERLAGVLHERSLREPDLRPGLLPGLGPGPGSDLGSGLGSGLGEGGRREGDAATDPLAALAPAHLDALEDWLGQAVQARERLDRSEARLAGLHERLQGGAELDAEATARHRRGLDLLEQWLRCDAARPPLGAWVRTAGAALLSGGLAAAAVWAGASAGFALPSALEPWSVALGVPGGIAGAALLFGGVAAALAAPPRAGRARRRIERELAASESTVPAVPDGGWSRGAALAERAELERVLAEGERMRGLRLEAEGAAEQHEHDVRREAAIEASRRALAERLGLDPDGGTLALGDLLDRLKRHRALLEASDRLAGAVAEFEARRDERRRELTRALTAMSGSETTMASGSRTQLPLDGASAAVHLDDLKDRSAHWRQAAAELTAAGRDLDRCARRRAEVEARRSALLARARIHVEGRPVESRSHESEQTPPDDESAGLTAARRELEGRVAQLEAYRSARKTVQDLEARVALLEGQLSDEPEVRSLSREELALHCAEAEQQAGQRDDLSSRIALIEQGVREAREGDLLERSMADVAEAEQRLEGVREERLLAEAGVFLLEDVETEYEEQSRPEVLERAMSLFAEFSEHRYALRLTKDGDGGVFRAVDADTGREHGLSELSDGTRMQLLLAARLAFAMQAEEGDPLPLFLDEALTASDPARFRAVVRVLLQLAADGRQVFYLTCDPADVAEWRAIAAERGSAAPHVVDLAVVRRRAAAPARASALEEAARPSVPAPDGLDAPAYGERLRVPLPGIHTPARSLHLFHLLRGELPLLHRLLAGARIETVGHWRGLAQRGAAATGLSEQEGARVDAWADLAEAFFEGIAIGRGAPIDRAVLHRSGAVSERFLDRLSDLARDLGGDARVFVDALDRREDERTKGFQAARQERLVAHLREQGHLTDAAPLSLDELRVRCLARLAGQVALGVLSAAEVTARIEGLYAQVLAADDSAAPDSAPDLAREPAPELAVDGAAASQGAGARGGRVGSARPAPIASTGAFAAPKSRS